MARTAKSRRSTQLASSHRPTFVRALLLSALATAAITLPGCSSSSTPAQTANKLIQNALKAQAAGNTSQAVKDLQSASAANPANPIPYYDIGVIYQKNNDSNNAIAQYHKALLANANYKPALFNLAILYTTSDPGQAISLYNQLLTLNPNDANVLFNLGLLLIAQNQATQGHADLKKAISLNPALAVAGPGRHHPVGTGDRLKSVIMCATGGRRAR